MAARPRARAPCKGFHVHYTVKPPATHEVSSIITLVLHPPKEDTGEVIAKPHTPQKVCLDHHGYRSLAGHLKGVGNGAKNIYLEHILRTGQIPIQTSTSCYNSFGDGEGLVSEGT